MPAAEAEAVLPGASSSVAFVKAVLAQTQGEFSDTFVGSRFQEAVGMTEMGAPFRHSTPQLYDRYMGPLLFEPYAKVLAERAVLLQPDRILETAAGTGIVTRVRLLRFLADQVRGQHEQTLRRFDRKPKRLASRRLFLLQGLPGVGPALAH